MITNSKKKEPIVIPSTSQSDRGQSTKNDKVTITTKDASVTIVKK